MFNIISRFVCYLIFVAAFCLSVTTSAVEVKDLYQVRIGVESQSSSDRWKAVLSGFKEVMVRKSGSEQVLSAYEVQQAYSKVTSYLQRYEYAVNQDDEGKLPFILNLHFEPKLIDQLIQEAGMPIWGSNRPISILWLAFEQDFQREIIKEDTFDGSFASQLAAHTQRRGIPVILPLMDLEDQVNVNISDVWGRFIGPVVAASERYLADSILTGRISRIGEMWHAKLSYINQNEQKNLEFAEATVEQLIATLSNRLAELLCEKYCVVETVESNRVTMQISNIRNFASFKQVESHLESLSSVREVDVEKLSATTVRFSVSLLGNLDSAIKGIQLAKKLTTEDAPSIDPFAKTIKLPVKIDENSDVALLKGQSENDKSIENNPLLANQIEPQLTQEVTPVILYFRWVE